MLRLAERPCVVQLLTQGVRSRRARAAGAPTAPRFLATAASAEPLSPPGAGNHHLPTFRTVLPTVCERTGAGGGRYGQPAVMPCPTAAAA